jgi:DTW domain-containing protein YfiP
MILTLYRLLLIVFFILNNMSASFKILLLTHAKELSRKSNTGKLITDTSFAKLISWEGRGDNIKISEAIDNLSQPVLIWIEGPKIIKDDHYAANPYPTYVILDGTWQEAKKMFRQGPECLRYYSHIFDIIFHILYQDIDMYVHMHMNICI